MRAYTGSAGNESLHGTVDRFGNRRRHPKPNVADHEALGKGIGTSPRREARKRKPFGLRMVYVPGGNRKEISWICWYATERARQNAYERASKPGFWLRAEIVE
jgi:hypothetical protein